MEPLKSKKKEKISIFLKTKFCFCSLLVIEIRFEFSFEVPLKNQANNRKMVYRSILPLDYILDNKNMDSKNKHKNL